MTRRIAAGETLAGALLGLVAGGLVFLAAGLLASRLVPAGASFYLSDLRPVPALAALVAVLVPVCAVLVTVSALRWVVVEPLGVVRLSGDHRRRLCWRLILPVAGLALLYPLHTGLTGRGDEFAYQVVAGTATLLVGMALLLPWLVETTVRRLGGGNVAWQLAVRRLQLDSGTAVRAVSGIAVSVAGVIALQGLLAAVQTQYTQETGGNNDQFQAKVLPRDADPDGRWTAALKRAPGVRTAGAATTVKATPTQPAAQATDIRLKVGDCTVLRQFPRIDTCTDGDTFVAASDRYPAPPRPGSTYTLGDPEAGPALPWTLPATARTVPAHNDGGIQAAGGWTIILVTPAALGGSRPAPLLVDLYVALDPADPDALDRLRNAAAQVDPRADVTLIQTRTVGATLLKIRQGLVLGATALLVLIGASMLVNVIEQLRERRRLLAVLVAFGVRRTTLSGSVLCQVAIPVLLGLTLAVVTGTGLAAILQTAAKAPIRFDWPGIGATSCADALVVLLTTTASLPLLWRLTRPGGLPSE